MSRHILVIDDDADTAATVRAILTAEGYDVVTACDGLDGLVKLFDMPCPALIIVDIWMPRLDGWAFMRAIEQGPFSHVPILIASASRPNGRHKNFAFLGKPIDGEALLSKVREHVGE